MQASTRPEIPPGLLAGRLEGISLPDMMWALCGRRMTGVLQVRRRVRQTVYLQDGRIVFAATSDPNRRLGEMLLRRGKISLDQLEDALTRLQSGRRLGTLLVQAGYLTPDELVEAVVGQVKSIVLDLLSWEEGEYSFQEGPLPIQEVITLQMRTSDLLLQGIRGIQSFSRIRGSVGGPRTVYGLTERWRDAAEGLSLTEGESLLLERLGQREESVENLCREVFLSNFEIHQALWAFKVLGLVQERDRQAGAPGKALAGRLDQGGFAELLIQIGRAGQTGVLHTGRRSVQRTFHIRDRRCVFATSNDTNDGLITYLLRRGVISLRDQEETAKRLLSNKRVGTILREMGVIDDGDLREMVRQQLSEIVYDTFRWEDGDYAFIPGPLPTIEEITLDMNLESLVAEGLRRVTSWTRVIKGCGGVDAPLSLTPHYLDVLDAMNASVDEWQVVNALRSPQSPRRVCRLSELSDFRICQILWTFKLLGAVEPFAGEASESMPQEAPEPVPAVVAAESSPAAAPESTQLLSRDEVAAALRQLQPTPVAEPVGSAQQEEPAGDPFVHVPVRPAALPRPAPMPAPQPRSEMDGSELEVAAPAVHEDLVDEVQLEEEPPLPVVIGPGETMRLSRSEVDAALAAAPQGELAARFADARPLDAPPDVEAEASDPAGQVAPAAPDWEPPGDLEAVISRFNAVHRLVYRAVRSEVGAGAVNFVRSCCTRLERESADLVLEAELNADGSWDEGSLRRSILGRRVADPWSIYEQLIDQELELLRGHLGESRMMELCERIRQVEQAEVTG